MNHVVLMGFTVKPIIHDQWRMRYTVRNPTYVLAIREEIAINGTRESCKSKMDRIQKADKYT